MSNGTVRATRAGLLVLPDESLEVGVRLDGFVLRFNPHTQGVDAAIHRVLDALPDDAPRCEAVLRVVAEATARRAQ